MLGMLAMLVYIGCSTDAKHPDGIVAVDVSESGAMRVIEKYSTISNAIYLARSPDGKYIYSCDSVGLVAFSDNNGKLLETDRLNLSLRCVCHVSVSQDGKKVFFADYADGKAGSVEVKDGKFFNCVIHAHKGSGPNKPRQNSAHCHQAVPSPDGKGYIVVDLGLDSLFEYRLEDSRDHSSVERRKFDTALPGAGPRHLVFHPNGKTAFLVSELYSKLQSISWSAERGFEKTLFSVNTLASDDNGRGEGRDLAAAVRMAPCKKRVVMSNRGENSLVVFDCCGETGQLKFKSRFLLPGSWPRDFLFLSDTLAIVTMERSGQLHTLSYNPDAGEFKLLNTIDGLFRPVAALR
jgi:6-phosphogluconolactonase